MFHHFKFTKQRVIFFIHFIFTLAIFGGAKICFVPTAKVGTIGAAMRVYNIGLLI